MNIRTILNILSALLVILGVSMVFPSTIAYGYGENDLDGFLWSMLICFVFGVPVWLITRKNRKLTNKDGFAIVTFTWITAALIGALPFYISGVIPNFTDAFFESMSGVTTTGASIIGSSVTLPNLPNGIESLPHATLFWRSFIQWIGGMGIIVFYIAILPLLGVGGVQLFKAEVPGPVADKIRPRVRETAKILWMVYLGITATQIVLLVISGMPWFDAVCHSFTTMPTGGFSIKNASIGYYNSATIQYIIIFFMFLAGINFSLHFLALTGNVKSYFRDKEFLAFFGIILVVTFLIFSSVSAGVNEWSEKHFRDSLFQTISILTTTGFSTADYELWSFFAQFMILFMMFVGGMGGSTGGGMKIVRLMLLFKYAATETRRMLHLKAIIPIRIGNRFISEDVIRNTLGFFLFYMSIFTITTLVLTTMNIDLESSIGAAASAIGNIGPGLGAFGPTDNYALLPAFGKWMLCFCMLLGRLEIFTIMVLFSRTFWK
ncbi:MAG: potassium transporter TrkG [Candidatus Marinimicrobia bacterium]|jgi:trk system potassium uptake protein TrkH|nr:potassium transporter TrkG [Candidatus Neomarinimicrobiota bacterium]MDP6726631.1 potassium transporter TrkG [Candidatus Neomarinimicrobiota bacterium]|tara:strand:- start:30927 stop:32396 length:1470 start_codon:yes stop_codon:yes gene_type:complete